MRRGAGNDPAVPSAQADVPLTARQLSVARAVAGSKTNRQIAEELYITTKTLEFHISQIMTRLGVDSRSQIASALRADAVRPAGIS